MVKQILIKPIDSASAKAIVRRFHYSGKSTQNSQIHLGAFLHGKLEGVMQFGPSIDKRRMAQNLGIGFNESIELNRMAFGERLPKNSESRSLGVALRMLKKTYPHLRVCVSFADACQCGDGTIYRASGFKLHSFKKNSSLLIGPTGDVIAKKSLDDHINVDGKYLSYHYINEKKYKKLEGYQMKYLYFFDKKLQSRFKFVDFKDIPDDVRMYRGKKLGASGVESGTTSFQEVGSGESPTDALQSHLEHESSS